MKAAFCRGIYRKGLGMAQESVWQQLLGWFEEATVELKRDQLKFLKRAMQSQNRLVTVMSWFLNRNRMTFRGIASVEGNREIH